MNAIAKTQGAGALAMTDQELINVLQTSLYPGAKVESVKMVMSYCAAAGLDPLQKPVHIVPMSVKDSQSGKYDFRDVIMPGIGLYRIQAERSKTYAGMDAPVFGDMVKGEFKNKGGNEVKAEYPEWCEVTVSKLIGSQLVTFTAREYWIENYATDSNKSTAPNAMWKKRPRGQLAKCAEAQALRKGWPEIGQAPTAEEMEGKEIDITPQDEPVDRLEPPELPDYPQETLDGNIKKWGELIAEGKTSAPHIVSMVSTKHKLSTDQKLQIANLETQGEE